MPAPFFDFYRSLIHDLRSSRRFQFATLLWIPLIITLGVLIVHFGQRHSNEEKYHEWKSTFVAESYIQLPDLLIYVGNPNYISGSVQQGQGAVTQINTLQPCPAPLNTSHVRCLLVPTHLFQSHGTYGNDQERVLITLNFLPAQDNSDIYVHAPVVVDRGAPSWTQWGVPVRANNPNGGHIAVHLEPSRIYPMEAPMVAMWDTYVHYWSTLWANTQQQYQTTLSVRVPYAYVRASWESVPLNSWLLLAVWGGGITFFYVLHWLIFSCAKIAFLPDDSELLRSSPGGAASGFETIK